MFDYDDSDIEYIGGGSTSHSGYNIGLAQDLIEKYSGKRIPTIQGEWFDSEEMTEICQRILDGDEVDKVDMRSRIELFKKLSDQGYYLSYECVY